MDIIIESSVSQSHGSTSNKAYHNRNEAYSTINMRITKGAASSDLNFKDNSDCLVPRFIHKENCTTGQIIEMICQVI